MDAEYNDINGWDYTGLVDVMGGSKTSGKHIIKTNAELDKLLKDSAFNSVEKLQFIEVYMPRENAPI